MKLKFWETLVAMKGDFVLDGHAGAIRHKTIRDAKGCLACPVIAVLEASGFDDVRLDNDFAEDLQDCFDDVPDIYAIIGGADNDPGFSFSRQALLAVVGLPVNSKTLPWLPWMEAPSETPN